MVDLSQHELHVAQSIRDCFVPDTEIIVFGSWIHVVRPRTRHQGQYSARLKLLAEIKEAFQESEFPFRVDIIDWNGISPANRKAIETNSFELLP
jgi:hypothetical protein